MRQRTRLLILAAAVGLLAPVAASTSPASAIDQDLQVSATSGAAGAMIDVSSATCGANNDDEGDTFQFLSVALIAGTAPDEVLAGAANGFDDQQATFVVPDWIDPAQPAVIEAKCTTVTFDFDSETTTQTDEAYDPVAFDVLDSVDAPVQARTFSRTAMNVGQAFQVDGTGCFLDDASYSGVDIIAGDDPTGRDISNYLTSGDGDVDGDAFTALAALVNGGGSVHVSQVNDERPTIEVEEIPNSIEPGPATAFPYCGNDDGVILLFQPQLLDVTGTSPVDDIDLVVPPKTRDVTLSGGSCTAGPVDAIVFGDSAEDISDGDAIGQQAEPTTALSAVLGSDATVAAAQLRAAHGIATVGPLSGARAVHSARATKASRASKGLADEGFVETTIDPDADGAWAYADHVDYDLGTVSAFAACGDPLAEGFAYDTQLAIVDVPPAPTTTTTSTTTSTTAPPSAPANAIPGNANYAG